MQAATDPIALVFTDVQGSTELWEKAPRAMEQALQLHDETLRRLLPAHGGRIVKSEGDGFLLAFPEPAAAVRWSLEAQEALQQCNWPADLLRQEGAAPAPGFRGLRVRMGVHFGAPNATVDPSTGGMDYVGPAVNRAARVAQAAHGGQVLLSEAVWEAVREKTDAVCRDLGDHRLKGLERTERLWQVLPRSLEERTFPPPRTLDVRMSNLPSRPSSFVGRLGEVAAVEKLFADGARLVTVLGPAGIGKTRLALRFGSLSLHEYSPRGGGVWLCDLSQARSLEDVVRAAAAALGVPLTSGRSVEDGIQQLGHAIGGRGAVLLLFDNFEQVAAHAHATLGVWLGRAPQARFLVTSRERLGLEGETLFELEPLPLADAVRLFSDRAGAARPLPAGAGAAGEPGGEEIQEIVRRLDRIPLAIELAAARSNALSPRQILERLSDRFQLLHGGGRQADRQSTLRAAIDWSWDLLQPWEKAALAQCTLFRGSFTLEAAEAVLDLSPWEEGRAAIDVVQALRDKSLLYRRDSIGASGRSHLGLYESIREYAAEKLGDPRMVELPRSRRTWSSLQDEAALRHGRYFARLGEAESIDALSAHGGAQARRRLALDLDDLLAAADRAITRRDAGIASKCCLAAMEVFALHGPLDGGAELAERVLGLDGLTPSSRGRLLLARGRALVETGRAEAARAALEEALSLALEGADASLEAEARRALATVEHVAGRLEEARESYESALAAARYCGDRRSEGTVLGNLAVLLRQQGRIEEAKVLYREALEIAAARGDRVAEGQVLSNLGYLHTACGQPEEARRYYSGALQAAQEADHRRFVGIFRGNIANLDREQGRFGEAIENYGEALASARLMGDRRYEGIVLADLAGLHQAEGKLEEARKEYEDGLAIHREVNDRRSEAVALANLGSLLLDEGRLDAAQDRLRESLGLVQQLGDRRVEGAVLGIIAEAQLLSGDLPAARSSVERGEGILRNAGDPIELAKVFCVRGRVEAAAGRIEGARRLLEEASDAARRAAVGPPSQLGRAIERLRKALAARA